MLLLVPKLSLGNTLIPGSSSFQNEIHIHEETSIKNLRINSGKSVQYKKMTIRKPGSQEKTKGFYQALSA